MVFTHGTFDDHGSLDVLTPSFTSAGYRIVAWDLPGHGADASDGRGFDLGGAARDLVRLLDELGARQAVLVGHSLGGYISQEAAIQAPDRVRALVVIGATGLVAPPAVVPMAALRASLVVVRLVPSWLLRRRVAVHSTRTAAAVAHSRRVARKVTKVAVVRIRSAFVHATGHIDPRRRLVVPTSSAAASTTATASSPPPPRGGQGAAPTSGTTSFPMPGTSLTATTPADTAEAVLSFLAEFR